MVHHLWALKNCVSSVFSKISQTLILSQWKGSTRRELDESSVGEERGSAVALKEEGERSPNCDNDRFSRIVKVLRCRRNVKECACLQRLRARQCCCQERARDSLPSLPDRLAVSAVHADASGRNCLTITFACARKVRL